MANDPSRSRLFREEAIAHHFRDRESSALLHASPPWTWAVLLVSTVVIGLAATFVVMAEIDVTERAEGWVRVPADSGAIRVSAEFAAADALLLRIGDRVRLELRASPRPVSGAWDGRIVAVEAGARGALLRVDVEVLSPPQGSLTTTRLSSGTPVTVQATIGRRRLVAYMLDTVRQ
ncbi:hypothetical protein ACCAA_920016 [Candidatus Accumulibacter aalborgensis]|uniref:HlyD family secretion protein n=1 Tax=Candidatus Accumulibacter aalborgensis TaxID=1860102 RepID=A0A1A8Y1H2_9PROT|nr:hypothetical protein [Candidatus Accumulibacter aalborgensis]SBT10228.1 hypothetical protein ACCAA_920016 [Candidatus Accumulibacter aalborgensis]